MPTDIYKYPLDSKVLHNGNRATVREHCGINQMGIAEYYIVYEDAFLEYNYVFEGDIREADLSTTPTHGCSCGSRFTEFPELHMFYCSKYRSPYD